MTSVSAQVNSGSDGHDGAFIPPTDVVINMADHPDGIYHYTSVYISNNVTVTFIPNVNNSPVTWLVQSDCVINGRIDLSGKDGSDYAIGGQGGNGGPGGCAGGRGGGHEVDGAYGVGTGGGQCGLANGSHCGGGGGYGAASPQPDTSRPGGLSYGNADLLPLIGGSGGGGGAGVVYDGGPNEYGNGGGGGGGAICIAVSGTLTVTWQITACGGNGGYGWRGGNGSGGAIRLVATKLLGAGLLDCSPNSPVKTGRIRIDAFENFFKGTTRGVFTQGFQPIILFPSEQQPQLSIVSLAGQPVPEIPTGNTATPDVLIAGEVANPVPVVVQCSKLPLNTTITLHVSPQTAPDVFATAVNSSGTEASSTATFSVSLPHGGGLMYSRCVIGIADESYSSNVTGLEHQSLAQTGWSATGERFVAMELTAQLGKSQKVVYVTESGKRIPFL